jgi:hypothetical protein
MQHRAKPLAVVFALAAQLAGCAAVRPSVDEYAAPQIGDEGILLTESEMLPGVTGAATASGTPDDCAGPGLGIMVGSSTAGGKYLYDSNGEPCDAAKVLFDGRTALDSRAADPTISLSFHDATGPIPPPRAEIPRIDTSVTPPKAEAKVAVAQKPKQPAPGTTLGEPKPAPGKLATAADPVIPARRVVKEAPTPKPDPLLTTLSSWRVADNAASARTREADAAAARNLENIAREERTSQEQDTIAALAAKLRERERQIQEEQRRQAETLERSEKNRQQTSAAHQAWQQRESELQAELDATQERLKQFEQLNNRLQQEKSQKEHSYQQEIQGLTSDLKAAQAQADVSRRSLIIQAAAKIAEAEKLAAAAALQERDAQLREATRLKHEADAMMDKALALQSGKSSALAALEPAADTEQPLETVPVVLHAKNQTLEQLLATALQQAASKAGPWKSDWQLSAAAQYILKEKWSLTAEAPVQQVFDQLATQVKKAHNITLTFTQFNQSRLVVVTDTPPATR